MCGGDCPPETPVCRDLGDLCACTPDVLPCELSTPGMCGGSCPDDMPVCRDFGDMCACFFF
jgi:hypothetical protein